MSTKLTKTLSIDTILGKQEDYEDVDTAPFLLVFAQLSEGISIPFAYDLKMYRSHALPDVDVAGLINTRVAVGVRYKDKDEDKLIKRVGVIATMNKTGVNDEQHKFKANQFNVYSAHVVPSFKMLDNETTFRTFENQKFSDIFKEVIDDFPGIVSNSYVNFGQLSAEDDALFEYCVQFGESSFNFLSRLMQQLGIWYMFDHRDVVDDESANETMVLGKSLIMAQQCDSDQMKIDRFEANEGQIAQFSRGYVPAVHHVWVADFNESDPTQPPKEPEGGGDRDVMENFDLQPGEPKTTSRFMMEQFPNNGSAETLMRSQEYGVFLASGQSKNMTFQAGRTFRITDDDTDTGNQGSVFLLTAVNYTVLDYSYETSTGWDLLNLLGDATWRQLPPNQNVFNVLGSFSSSGLSNYLQNEGPYAVAVNTMGKKKDGSAGGGNMPYFLNFAAGGPIAAAGGVLAQVLMASLGDLYKDIFHKHDNPSTNTFVATPYSAAGWRMPLPAATSPSVHGVHLAVVVGSKGVDASQRGTLHTNGKGQVRVRFGWQRKVPQASGEPLDPLTTDQRAAWVRVAENWAGRTYGSQFLPRVGDEVVVSFIDGDPSRPIVTGRVYNDYAQQPFDPLETTQSGIRTQTTPPPSTGKPGFHLVRFDDKPGAEQLLLRAQNRMDVAVLGNRYVGVGGHSHETIGWVDPAHQVVGGSYFGKVCEDYHLHVGDPAGVLNGGYRYETMEKDYHLHVKQQTHFNLDGNWSVSVGGKASISADSIVLNAVKSITLVVGSSVVVVQPDGIYNEAPIHYEQCGAQGHQAAAAELHEPTAPTGPDSGQPKKQKKT